MSSRALRRAKKIFDDDFADQVLSFDSDAADMYAEIAASRRAAGKPISQFDAMIVALARSRGASLATRNVKDFEDCGVDVINPWTV
jgi:toxin FitB